MLQGQDHHDDAQAGGHDDCDQERLFEDAIEVQEHEDAPTRPKRSPKPNPRYSPDDYNLNCVSGKPRTKSRRSIRRVGGHQDDPPRPLEGEEGA